jgi:hypothetical protein
VPPYFTPADANLFRSLVALASSIHAGCSQCSFGITPNATEEEFAIMFVILLDYCTIREIQGPRLKILRERHIVQKHMDNHVSDSIESILQMVNTIKGAI